MQVPILIPKCKCGAEMMILDRFSDGSFSAACMYCDMPHEESSIYINHCWNCKGPIDSRVDQRSPRPNKGYICRKCGYDLQGPVYERKVA